MGSSRSTGYEKAEVLSDTLEAQFQQKNDSSDAAMTEICNGAVQEFARALASKSQLIILTEGQENAVYSCWCSPGFKRYPK